MYQEENCRIGFRKLKLSEHIKGIGIKRIEVEIGVFLLSLNSPKFTA